MEEKSFFAITDYEISLLKKYIFETTESIIFEKVDDLFNWSPRSKDVISLRFCFEENEINFSFIFKSILEPFESVDLLQDRQIVKSK